MESLLLLATKNETMCRQNRGRLKTDGDVLHYGIRL